MFSIRLYRKILFYVLFFIFLSWVVVDPTIILSIEDGISIFLFIFFVHAWIDKKYLLRKLSLKFNAQRQLIKNLFMHCPDLVYYKDKNLRYCDCNPSMKKMLNIEEENEISDKTDFDFFPKETALMIRRYDQRVLKLGQIVSYKLAKKFINGEVKVYDTMLAPMQENNRIVGILGVMRDITQTEDLKERLVIKNTQLNAILDNMPFLIYIKDLDGKFITGNKKLEERLGYSREELEGKSPADTYLIQYADDIKKEDFKVINERMELLGEKYVQTPDGKYSWFNVLKSPICDDNNDVIGIIVIIKNIDKEKEIESQKETFVATLTHDLKTPTTAQICALKLILKESLGSINSEQKDMLEQTLNSNNYMSDLISTILSTYKNDNGETKLKIDEFDLFELVNSTCKEISNLSMEKNLNLILTSRLENNLIQGDKLQIKRVIMNLVSNGIYYAFPKTDIEIIIEGQEKNVVFKVINKSKYIPQEKLKELFQKFKTGAAAKFNKTSTGLGLYLSKQIICAHKGEMYATSTEDEINTFGFIIPREPAPLLQEVQ